MNEVGQPAFEIRGRGFLQILIEYPQTKLNGGEVQRKYYVGLLTVGEWPGQSLQQH